MTRNENGRSMFEIRGVLAVIAVLTITALAGCRYAIVNIKPMKQSMN